MFGNRLATIYGMKMIAYAMSVPFTFTCGMGEGERPLGAAYLMQLNSDQPGPAPNRNGVQHSVEDVCHECDGLICGWTKMNLDL